MAHSIGKRAKRKTAPGTAPGTLVPDPTAAPVHLQVIAYGPTTFEEADVRDVADIQKFRDKHPVVWVNVNGLADVEKIKALGQAFHLHPLALEDAVNTYQRPKIDQFDTHDFIVVRMANRVDKADMEQLSVFLGGNFVVTLQEEAGDCFNPVRDRIRRSVGRIRTGGADYLAYALLDAVIDFYFPVLEHYGEMLDAVEQDALETRDAKLPSRIHGLRRDLLTFRRAVWPLRDAMSGWLRDPSARLQADTRVYLRDLYDHTVQLIDLLETYREFSSDLMDIYLSGVNLRMNEIMKVLTIISTIFIPMTFIASIYGMNFHHMPELDWKWGYALVIGIMVTLAAIMLRFFRKKGWL